MFLYRLFLMLFCTLAVIASLFSQQKIVAPIERVAFDHTTSYESLQEFLAAVGTAPGMQVERIALSRQGRDISVVKIAGGRSFGSDTKALRVLIFAQQHGDEPSGKEALTLLLSRLVSDPQSSWKQNLDLLIVPQMNPDGAELRQRRTSDSLDLNRNHALLTSPETKGLHDLFYRWKPEVTLDIHEYTTGKEWRDSGMSRITDVQLGMLTHPSTPGRIRKMQHEGMYPFIASAMKAKKFHFHEYIVGAPDSRVRHSTTEINDGRQSFGILNTLSFIQEGLKWAGLEDSLRRRTEAQLTAIAAFLDYCSSHAAEIRSTISAERAALPSAADSPIAIRMERTTGETQMTIPVYSLRSKNDTVWTITPYHSVVRTHLIETIPSAYIIPKDLKPVLELFRRHHIAVETVPARKSYDVELFTVDSVTTEIIEEDPRVRVYGQWNPVEYVAQKGDVMVRTGQWHSALISILLEPASVWGLTGYPMFAPALNNPGNYPILRIRNNSRP